MRRYIWAKNYQSAQKKARKGLADKYTITTITRKKTPRLYRGMKQWIIYYREKKRRR